MDKPGYHLREIKRGVLGESSKIREELEELEDAEQQGVKLMVLQELSDIIGTVRAYLETHHPSVTLDDLIAMNAVTKRAFDNGHRTVERAVPPEAAPPAPAHTWTTRVASTGKVCSACSDPYNDYMGDKKGPCPGRKARVLGNFHPDPTCLARVYGEERECTCRKACDTCDGFGHGSQCTNRPG